MSGRGNGVLVLAVNKCPDTAQLLTMVSPADIHHLIWFSWLTERPGVRYNRSPHLWPEPTNYFTLTLFTPDIHSRVWDQECWIHAAAKSNLNKQTKKILFALHLKLCCAVFPCLVQIQIKLLTMTRFAGCVQLVSCVSLSIDIWYDVCLQFTITASACWGPAHSVGTHYNSIHSTPSPALTVLCSDHTLFVQQSPQP